MSLSVCLKRYSASRPEVCVNYYCQRYCHLKILNIWLNSPIPAPIFTFLGDVDPQTLFFVIETPKRHISDSPWIRPHSLFSTILNALLFGWTLWIEWPNLKSAALHVREIIRRTLQLWAAPGYAQATFSAKIVTGFYSDGPCECTGRIWSK